MNHDTTQPIRRRPLLSESALKAASLEVGKRRRAIDANNRDAEAKAAANSKAYCNIHDQVKAHGF